MARSVATSVSGTHASSAPSMASPAASRRAAKLHPSVWMSLPFLALLAIALGYVDLSLGGITRAPILLVLGYCVLVPVAIWHWRPAPAAPARTVMPKPSYRAATFVSLVILALYLATLAPSTTMWDTSEYMVAAYTMGLPHPPGNPLFVLIGRVFAILPIATTVAIRINLLAALCSAASAGMWFCIIERVTTSWLPSRWQQIAVAAIGALLGATAFTVWN